MNSRLKRVVCSTFLFREIILDIAIKFKKKKSNDILKNKINEVLNFYISNYLIKRKTELLNISKYKKIQLLYEEIDFININKKYNDEDDGDIWRYRYYVQ